MIIFYARRYNSLPGPGVDLPALQLRPQAPDRPTSPPQPRTSARDISQPGTGTLQIKYNPLFFVFAIFIIMMAIFP